MEGRRRCRDFVDTSGMTWETVRRNLEKDTEEIITDLYFTQKPLFFNRIHTYVFAVPEKE